MLFEGFYSQMPFAWRYRSTIVAALAVFVFKRELSNFVDLTALNGFSLGVVQRLLTRFAAIALSALKAPWLRRKECCLIK